jgi:glucose-6-phosphate 1-dehydrogenase
MRISPSPLNFLFEFLFFFFLLSYERYERLLQDVIEGDHSLFLQTEELKEAWRIFTPVLQQLLDVQPEIYPFGSRMLL